jgi:hypothetical protein
MWFIWSFNIFVPITSAGLSPKSLKKKISHKGKINKRKSDFTTIRHFTKFEYGIRKNKKQNFQKSNAIFTRYSK